MEIKITNPVECASWNTILDSMPEHSFFHTSEWARVLCESYSYKPLYFGNSACSVLIPVMEIRSPFTGKRGVGIPFSDYCEPIASSGQNFIAAFDEAIQYGKKAGWKYLELRGGAKYLGNEVPYRTYLRHVLKLHSEESILFKGLAGANRRNIRKAAESGVRVTISDSEQDLDKYFKLHCLTRKRHGVPPQPRSFFKAIYRNVISTGKGFTVLGTYQGRPISGAVYFHSGKKAIYKFGASDLNYQHLRPANLVMWETIRWFSKNGFEELCFGRTDLQNAGLIRFKSSWGAREESLYYYRYDLKGSAFVKGLPEISGLGERIFRGLPVPFLRLAGELLYRHMG